MLIAGIADGALRDALSLLDRCMSVSMSIDDEVVRNAAGLAGKDYIYELAACAINKSTARALEKIDELYAESKDMSRLCDELIAHFRALMLIKSVRDPRAILVMSDDEFEQAQTQSDYLSVADIVYYMDVLSRAYMRMGHSAGDRTELEMAMVKLSSPELDVTNEAMAARITALEKAVKRGIKAVQAETLPEPKPVKKEEPKPEAPPEPKTEEPKPEKAEEKPKEPPKEQPKPKPAPPVNKQAQNVDLDEIYRNAKPFPNWVEVVESLKPISRTIAASFSGSTAYVSGNYLLIDTNNEMAFDLLRQSSQRQQIREIISETTGRVYRLGPYKRPEKKQEKTDPMQVFKNKLKESGVEVVEE